MKPSNELESRVEELEMKLTFHEQTIEELNSALIQQQSDFRKMTRMLENVASQVENLNPDNQEHKQIEPPPPHY
ncbi:MAG: SlyX family protein [Kangiellaceae bacterium]